MYYGSYSRNRKSEELKPSVAIIIPGGIGTGKNNIGIPVLERIIKLLAVDFSITVFQLFKRNQDYEIDSFELIDVYSSNSVIKIVKFFIAFAKSRKKQKFQAVHGFWVLPSGFLAVLIGKAFRIKSVVSVLGGDAIALPEINYGQLRNFFYRRLIFWTLRHANEANALTHYLVNNLRQVGFVRNDLKVIPWGVDINLFKFREKRINGPLQFLHIANLHLVKDQETLLRAFKIINEQIPSQLTIIGEGILKDYIRKLIEQLNLSEKVTVLGQQPYEKLPDYYHGSDILLHTSLSEGQCEVVTEAMSCGVLVCGTKVGLIHDLADCCIFVGVKDYESLAKEILQVINNDDRMSLLRKRARLWAHDHSILWTVGELKRIYNPSDLIA